WAWYPCCGRSTRPARPRGRSLKQDPRRWAPEASPPPTTGRDRGRMATTLRSTGAPPDLTRLTVLHRAMRTGAARPAAAVATVDEAGADRVSALARWYRGFSAAARAHLRHEDERLFPALAEQVPSFDDHAERIEHEHRQLDRALARVGAALDEL